MDIVDICVDMFLYSNVNVLRANITPVDNFMFSGLRRKLDPCLFQQVSR